VERVNWPLKPKQTIVTVARHWWPMNARTDAAGKSLPLKSQQRNFRTLPCFSFNALFRHYLSSPLTDYLFLIAKLVRRGLDFSQENFVSIKPALLVGVLRGSASSGRYRGRKSAG
jgi:hypothetical protein